MYLFYMCLRLNYKFPRLYGPYVGFFPLHLWSFPRGESVSYKCFLMGMKQRKKCFWKQPLWKLPEKAVQRSEGDYSSVWKGFKEIPSLGDDSAHPCLYASARCFREALRGETLSVSLPMKISAWSNNLCYFWQL